MYQAAKTMHYLSRNTRNRYSGFPTRSDTNRPVQSQKQTRSLKFRIQEEENLYYPCSEIKGADQLRSFFEADLRLCFRIGKNPVFSLCGSKFLKYILLLYSPIVTIENGSGNFIAVEPTVCKCMKCSNHQV